MQMVPFIIVDRLNSYLFSLLWFLILSVQSDTGIVYEQKAVFSTSQDYSLCHHYCYNLIHSFDVRYLTSQFMINWCKPHIHVTKDPVSEVSKLLLRITACNVNSLSVSMRTVTGIFLRTTGPTKCAFARCHCSFAVWWTFDVKSRFAILVVICLCER